MKKKGFFSRLSLLALSAALVSGMTLGCVADRESSYDMDYYSQLADKGVTINVYNISPTEMTIRWMSMRSLRN